MATDIGASARDNTSVGCAAETFTPPPPSRSPPERPTEDEAEMREQAPETLTAFPGEGEEDGEGEGQPTRGCVPGEDPTEQTSHQALSSPEEQTTGGILSGNTDNETARDGKDAESLAGGEGSDEDSTRREAVQGSLAHEEDGARPKSYATIEPGASAGETGRGGESGAPTATAEGGTEELKTTSEKPTSEVWMVVLKY